MTKQTDSIIKTVPAAAELRKVPGFDPLRYLRRTTSKKSGEPVLKLDLPYKKLWFRLACPNSRTFLKPLRITDQMAIFEAQLFLDRSDQEPIANFTSTMMARDVPGGRYIQAAQDEALNEALDSAGFGIQLADLVETDGGSGYGSEIPLAQVEAVVGGVKQPAPVEHEEPPAPAAVPETPPQAVHAPAEPVPAPPAVGSPAQVQNVPPAVAVTAPPAAETPMETAPATPEETPVEAAPDVPEETPTQEVPAQAEVPKNETADVLHLLGGTAQAATPEVKAEPQAQAAPAVETPQPEPAAEEPAAPVTYTEDMSVEEIRKRITVEQAMAVPVDFGTCKGWTLGQVLDRRPSSLRFYVYAAKEASHVLKAAASLLLDGMNQQKAG